MKATSPREEKRLLKEQWKGALEENRNAVLAGEKARDAREGLVVQAAQAGVSKTDIHRLTGISRTAIYNILNKHNALGE